MSSINFISYCNSDTYRIDNFSKRGDWTKWNPWRSPGTAGKGNLKFQPCGVNSGSNPSFPDPPAHGQKQFANGTDLPPISQKTIWKMGSVVDAEWSIYANHGGGYSYRLCKKVKGKVGASTKGETLTSEDPSQFKRKQHQVDRNSP